MTNKSRSIAINGILIALMLVMTATMLFTGVAVLPLVVLVVGMVVVGKWTALILGFSFGLFSLISAFIIPSVTAPFFQNPLVSLLPRILSAAFAYGVYWLANFVITKVNKRQKKQMNSYVQNGISTALGAIFVVFFNTLFVLSMIWILFNGKTINGEFVNKEFIMGFISLNFAIEIIVTPIVAVPVALAVDKFLKKSKKQVVTEADLIELESNGENVSFETTSDTKYLTETSEDFSFANNEESVGTDNQNIQDKNTDNTDFHSENLKK